MVGRISKLTACIGTSSLNMLKKEKEILEDFKAFINWGIKNERTFDYILFNLNHDIVGLADKKDKLFLPRTHNYRKEEK